MKKALNIIIIFFVLMPLAIAVSIPITSSLSAKSRNIEYDEGVWDIEGMRLTYWAKKGYLEVETEGPTFRIWKCGQVKKLTWTEINPNEDSVDDQYFYFSGSATITDIWDGDVTTSISE